MAARESGRGATVLSAVAAVTYFLLAKYGPGWWRGARLDGVDAPLDLGWLHNGFAWLAQYAGAALSLLFGAAAVLLVLVAAAGVDSPRLDRVVAAARTAPALALLAVPALAVAWFLATQAALLVAPFLGMYHGEYHPAVP
ncbi:hypothetical protein AB0J72_46810 [Dactylosporangium sp. NPDC049742]|uniref:hypothetical protein n=1 Tax=Dactylosporangium sp. NPDC049742 TaxID=3154737 RepID=UPI003419FFC4